MTVDDPTRQAAAGRAELPRRLRGGLVALAYRSLRRVAGPYLRLRRRQAETAIALGRLQTAWEQAGERQAEQIERLEDLARELVRTAESLRVRVADLEATVAQTRKEP
jgi:hypothetical protein